MIARIPKFLFVSLSRPLFLLSLQDYIHCLNIVNECKFLLLDQYWWVEKRKSILSSFLLDQQSPAYLSQLI